MNFLRNPWGRPRVLVLVTALYIAWSILPVAVAILFAFNSGRSRTTWQAILTVWREEPRGVLSRRGMSDLQGEQKW